MYYYYLSNSVEIELMYLLKELMQQDGEAWRRHLSLIPVFMTMKKEMLLKNILKKINLIFLRKIKRKRVRRFVLGYNYEGNETT